MKYKPDDLIPATVAAELMGISKQRLYAYINAGRIKAIKKLGTRWYVHQEEVSRFQDGEVDVSGVYSEGWK